MNDVEIIDLHAQSCPATYAELLAKYSAVCKERDELKKELERTLKNSVEWHKMTIRHATQEERDEFARLDIDGVEFLCDCIMPADGEEILVATKWGVDKDICSNYAEYGIGLEYRGDFDGVFAWAEMPQYKEDNNG